MLAEGALQAGGLANGWAGAWVHGDEKGYSSSGFQRDAGEYGDAWRADTYIERGVGENWAVVAKAETLWRDADSGEDRLAGQVAVRRSLFGGGGFVASGQFGVLLGESLEAPLCEGTGTDSRMLAGWSGPVGGKKVWISAETGFRNQGGCGRWKTDLALGIDLDDLWKLEAKAFHQSGDGPRSLKLETGLARKFDDQFIGLSYRREVGGAYEEDSWILTLSQQF